MINKLDDAIKEIKELSKEFKERNGNSSLRIPNKDFNLWLVQKLLEQDGRLIKVETKIKMFMRLVPIGVAIITLGFVSGAL